MAEPYGVELAGALTDASLLLDHAARNGLLPVAGVAPQGAGTLIEDLVRAFNAAKDGALPAEIEIPFWLAYARLAALARPVTAASLRACSGISLALFKTFAGALVMLVIVVSIFLFMSNTTATDTADLIEQQNAAAVKLWSDLQVLRADADADTPPAKGAEPTIMIEHTFDEMIEFSRRSSWLLQSASRLNFWFIPSWLRLSTDSVIFAPGQPIDHLNVSPRLSSLADIEREGLTQIECYQAIRDYALGLYKMESLLYGSMATYLLPTIYALLGAFLYGFRLYSRLIRRGAFLNSAAHSARYFVAAITGLVVGLFGSLLPKSLALPPLAIAFLAGYAVEACFSRLDDAIAKLKGEVLAPLQAPSMEAGAD